MSTTTDSKIRIQLEDFSVTDEIEAMKKVSRNIGGITTFLGTGREMSKGESITKLNFEHYPKMAEKKMEEIRVQSIKDFGIIDMSIIHRIGPIDIGENIVLIVAVGIGLQGFESAENAEAFAAVVAGADHAHQTSWRGIAAATFPLFPNALASNLSAPARITICTPGIHFHRQ